MNISSSGKPCDESIDAIADLPSLTLSSSKPHIFLSLTGELTKNLTQCQSFDHVRVLMVDNPDVFCP